MLVIATGVDLAKTMFQVHGVDENGNAEYALRADAVHTRASTKSLSSGSRCHEHTPPRRWRLARGHPARLEKAPGKQLFIQKPAQLDRTCTGLPVELAVDVLLDTPDADFFPRPAPLRPQLRSPSIAQRQTRSSYAPYPLLSLVDQRAQVPHGTDHRSSFQVRASQPKPNRPSRKTRAAGRALLRRSESARPSSSATVKTCATLWDTILDTCHENQ